MNAPEHPPEGGSSDQSGRTPLRPTGIRVVGDMPWGAHICLFYETKEDLLDANAAYIKAGLGSSEYCVWAISEPITEDEAWAVLRRDIPDLDECTATGQFEVLPGYDWYLKGDEFDSKKSRAAGMKSCNLRSTRASRACGSAATRFGLNAIAGTSFVNTNKN